MGVQVKTLKPLDMSILDQFTNGDHVVIGLIGPRGRAKHPEANVSMATIGTFQEFGTHQIPARSFMRHTTVEARDFLPGIIARAVPDGNILEAAGEFMRRLMTRTIYRSRTWARPNRPATLRQKEGTIPLIDSGAMVDAITWEVRHG